MLKSYDNVPLLIDNKIFCSWLIFWKQILCPFVILIMLWLQRQLLLFGQRIYVIWIVLVHWFLCFDVFVGFLFSSEFSMGPFGFMWRISKFMFQFPLFCKWLTNVESMFGLKCFDVFGTSCFEIMPVCLIRIGHSLNFIL